MKTKKNVVAAIFFHFFSRSALPAVKNAEKCPKSDLNFTTSEVVKTTSDLVLTTFELVLTTSKVVFAHFGPKKEKTVWFSPPVVQRYNIFEQNPNFDFFGASNKGLFTPDFAIRHPKKGAFCAWSRLQPLTQYAAFPIAENRVFSAKLQKSPSGAKFQNPGDLHRSVGNHFLHANSAVTELGLVHLNHLHGEDER